MRPQCGWQSDCQTRVGGVVKKTLVVPFGTAGVFAFKANFMTQITLFDLSEKWVSQDTILPRSGRPLLLRYHLVQTTGELQAMVDTLRATRDVTHDTETSGLKSALGARVIGHAFAAQTGPAELSAWYVPIRHANDPSEPQIDVSVVSRAVHDVLCAPGRAAWAHAKFDWAMNLADGIVHTREAHDVLVLANAANENEPSFALKSLATKYCVDSAADEESGMDAWMKADARSLKMHYRKRSTAGIEEVGVLGEPTYLERFGYARTPVKLCGRYACKDVIYTLYLWLVHYADTADRHAEVYLREMNMARRLHEMEVSGLPIDEALVRETYQRTGEQVTHWLATLRTLAADETLVPTDAAMSTLLYQTLGLECQKFTDGGKTHTKKPSVDREARLLLAAKYPEQESLLHAFDQLALVSKLHTTYSGSFLRYTNPETGKLYPAYNQLEKREKGVPVTGRLSSSDPNIQNISNKPLEIECADGVFVCNVRRYFTVPAGYIRLYVDFSQIELCVLAWFCQDENLLRAYREGLDVHQMTADLLAIKRGVAKAVNFLTVYGGTEHALALKMPGYYSEPEETRAEAKRVLASFDARYPGVMHFRRWFADQMRRNNCTFTNPYGRTRRIPDVANSIRWKRESAERRMMSSIVSGTSADLLKECMIKSTPILLHGNPLNRMVQSIHDELVFDLKHEPGWTDTVVGLVGMMEDQPMFTVAGPYGRGMGVPIKTSCSLTTTTWADKRGVPVSAETISDLIAAYPV